MYFDYPILQYANPFTLPFPNPVDQLAKNYEIVLKENRELAQKISELQKKLQKAQTLNKQMEQELYTMQESVQKFKKRKYIRKNHKPEVHFRCQINNCGRVYTSKTALVSHFRKKHEKK